MIYVLDSSAMIAFLRAEPGGSVVRDALEEAGSLVFAHASNFCETFYDFARAGGEEAGRLAVATLESAGVRERQELDRAFWQFAGLLKATHRRVSLADCFCLALAQRLGARLLTADRHELERLVPLGICDIQFIR